MDLHGGALYAQKDESDQRYAGYAVGLEAVGAGADGVAGVVAGAVGDYAGVAGVVFLDLEDDFHQVGADVGDFRENAAGDTEGGGAERLADGEADEAGAGVIAGNEEQDEEHHQELDADEHHADAHAGFEWRVIDRIGLAAQAGEGGARVREGVHANAEPGHAIASRHADEAERENDRQSDGDRLAGDRSEHAEVEHDYYGNEEPEKKQEFALGDEVSLAGFVDQLGNVAHRAVNGKILEAAINDQAKDQAKNAKENAEEKEFVAVDAEKLDLGKVGKFEIGLAAGFLRGLRERSDCGKQRNRGSNGAKFCDSTCQ